MDKELLKENRIHGDSLFPFSTYSIKCTSENVLDCHWHDEIEFLIVTKGKASFQIGASYYEVSEGEAIFISRGEIHAGFPIDNYNCSFNAIVFSSDLLLCNNADVIQIKYIEPMLNKNYILPIYIKGEFQWEKDILFKLQELIDIVNTKPFTYELIVKAQLFYIFSIFLQKSEKVMHNNYNINDYKIERLKKILGYIHNNYNKKLTLKDISKFINMSEGHLCRFFKEMLRRTLIDYINYYRINIAAKLLLDSSKKVIDVGIDVGFENCSYFISNFKHYMKCTPSEYRSTHLSE